MKKLIKVTREDIKNGIVGRGDSCPIALALKRQEKGVDRVCVGTGSIWTYKKFPKDTICYAAPVRVGQFIKRFDAGKKVEPFSFYLEAV